MQNGYSKYLYQIEIFTFSWKSTKLIQKLGFKFLLSVKNFLKVMISNDFFLLNRSKSQKKEAC